MRKLGIKNPQMLWLTIIAAFATITKSLPAWMNAGWGSDVTTPVFYFLIRYNYPIFCLIKKKPSTIWKKITDFVVSIFDVLTPIKGVGYGI